MQFMVYVLYSTKHDRYYVGQTSDLKLRLGRHNDGRVRSTKPYVPWKVVYSESFKTRSEAMRRERELKNKKSKVYLAQLAESRLGRD